MLAGPGPKLSRFYRPHCYLDLQKMIYLTYVMFLFHHHYLEWIFIYVHDWAVYALYEYPHSSTKDNKPSFFHCRSLRGSKERLTELSQAVKRHK